MVMLVLQQLRLTPILSSTVLMTVETHSCDCSDAAGMCVQQHIAIVLSYAGYTYQPWDGRLVVNPAARIAVQGWDSGGWMNTAARTVLGK